MNVVIFGFDNSGKTTLSNQLVDQLNLNGFKTSYVHSPGPITIEGMKKFMEDNLNDNSVEVKVFDRLPIIEEYVYGPILRNENRFADPEYSKSILDKVDLFVYCYPGLFTILNWGERDQYPGIKENALSCINQYNKLSVKLKQEGYNIKEYNFRCDDHNNPMELLKWN